MNIMTIDHLELYVADLAATEQLFCTGFGFRRIGQGGPETGLAGQRSAYLAHGGVRLLLTEGVASDHPARAYVDQHGDGVAVVALQTDAPEAVGQTVPGPGSLTHRLVRWRSDDPLPAGIAPAPDGGPAPPLEGSGELLGTIDHLALCVPAGELDATVAHYQRAFQFREIFEERVEIGNQAMDSKVVQSVTRRVTLTIVSPDASADPGQLEEFLRAHGAAGVQHVAFSTHDIVTAVQTFGSRGVRFLSTPDGYYDDVERRLGRTTRPVASLRSANVLVDRDRSGEMYQIFTESPFPRRTAFFELIERRGALTFGSNNIRALYEANERSRAAAAAGS